MKTKSSYQKLKDRISVLEKDINTLIVKEDSVDAIMIRLKYQIKHDTIESVTFGSRSNINGGGIIHMMDVKNIKVVDLPQS